MATLEIPSVRAAVTIALRLAKFFPHQDEASLLTNLLIRGKVVP
jgi:hypothetical protein